MHVLHIGSRRLAPTFHIFYRLCASLHRLCLVAYRRSGDVEESASAAPGPGTLHGGSGRPASSTCSKGHEHR